MELSKYIPTLEAVLFTRRQAVPFRLAAALELSEEKVEKTAVLLEEKAERTPKAESSFCGWATAFSLPPKSSMRPVRTAFELRRSAPFLGRI